LPDVPVPLPESQFWLIDTPTVIPDMSRADPKIRM
jgi:hypothetical protein